MISGNDADDSGTTTTETPEKQQLLHDKDATRKRRRESPVDQRERRLERQREYQSACRVPCLGIMGTMYLEDVISRVLGLLTHCSLYCYHT